MRPLATGPIGAGTQGVRGPDSRGGPCGSGRSGVQSDERQPTGSMGSPSSVTWITRKPQRSLLPRRSSCRYTGAAQRRARPTWSQDMRLRSHGFILSLAATLMATASWAGPPATGGTDTIGAYNPPSERFFLRNSNNAGAPDAGNFKFNVTAGAGDEVPLTCDWNGDGTDTVGAYNPASERFFLRNSNSAGAPDAGNFKFNVTLAPSDEVPVTGDWDGDGTCTIGAYNPASERFFLRNSNSAGAPDAGNFKFNVTLAASDEVPVTGDWNNDGTDTVGAYN